ncbi:MAG: hypothetical protein E7651_09265 [Ruminococcaceae bacterium]|nr:hypothetical protein [Oscillospiraceae bacterium]
MKRLCLLLTAVLLLTGCSANLSGLLHVSDTLSAEFGDRPGYHPEETSGTLSTEEIPVSDPTDRNMAFEPTATPGLYRVLTRTGDLKVLGMTYGDGVFFALTKRESGIAVTGYNEDGAGVFAGLIDEELTDPILLGYTAGFACIYAPASSTTLACRTDRTYVQLVREEADQVWLYDGGFAMKRGNTVSLYAPDQKEPAATFSLPEGYTWVQGNQTGAWVEKGGKLYLLAADGKLSGALSPLLTPKGDGYLCAANGSAVVVNSLQGMAYYDENAQALLACGKDFSAQRVEDGMRLLLPAEGKAATLPLGNTFTFGGRTKKGFLYHTDGVWFWYGASSMTPVTLAVASFTSAEDPLAVAARLMRSVAETQKGVSLSTEDLSEGELTAVGATDGELLFAACALLLQEGVLPAELTLCESITLDGERVGICKNGSAVCLDISHPEEIPSLLQSLLESEEPQA